MYSKKIEKIKKGLKLTSEQREILPGLLLGDAHLETQNGGKTYRLKIEYSAKNSEYCQHIYEIFKDLVLTPPRIRVKRSGEKQSTNISFSTLSLSSLRFYAQQFYKGKKKILPKVIKRLLSNKNLAYWFMDDGSIKSKESKGVILNTQGFTIDEVKKLALILNEKFDLDAWKRKQKDGCQIYISGYSYEKFIEIVDEWIIPSMRYKIPEKRRTQLPKR